MDRSGRADADAADARPLRVRLRRLLSRAGRPQVRSQAPRVRRQERARVALRAAELVGAADPHAGRILLPAQFPSGVVDYATYRTHLTLEGQAIESTRQETDTISRMAYGFASAYMLTGEAKYLEAAEKGTAYLRDHMRADNEKDDFVSWYHAIDVHNGHERKILASEFGDDYEAIPAYEQIYALAGPVQTFRATGDPRILRDAERTVNLFDRFFLDREKGGYFSHIDPVTLDPKDESLTPNRARKNWNSVGDHAPAFLIN